MDLAPVTMTQAQRDARLKKLQAELARRLKYEKYRVYEPTEKLEEFLNGIGSGKHFVHLLSAANGIGKSAAMANIVANLCWPLPGQSRYFGGDVFRDWPHPKRGRIISDPTTIKQTTIPELEKWLPEGRYTTRSAGKSYPYEWKTDTGWEFDLMTYDQDPKEFESSTLGIAIFDEPPPFAIFIATVARMRKGGIIIIVATPLTGSAWMYDKLVANPDPEYAERGGVFVVEADVETACKEHGVRGFLEHDHIERMVAHYPEDEKWARIHGRFQHLTGLVFKKFSRAVHVIKPFAITKRDYSVEHALDPHPRNPDAGVWIAVNRRNDRFVVDELYEKVYGVDELAAAIRSRNDQYRIGTMLIDPSAKIEDQHSQKALITMLSEQGLTYLQGTKKRQDSDRRIETALNYTRIGPDIVRPPELYIFDTCKRTIFELEHYQWDDWRGRGSEEKFPKERPKDKDDHIIECIGRILIREPLFIPYQPPVHNRSGVGVVEEIEMDPYG